MGSKPWIVATVFALFWLAAATATAMVDLVTLPKRDGVQLTIYNSADITLVRETRTLSLEKGRNRLEFSWANTLIDPTSISLHSRRQGVALVDLSFPPRIRGAAVWLITADKTQPCPVEISYFTSGLTWEAYYIGTLDRKETAIDLEGYVRVRNNSGEDYENAQTRLVVGKIRLLDHIAELARRQAPYGDPRPKGKPAPSAGLQRASMEEAVRYQKAAKVMLAADGVKAPKKIVKEGLSEYFLYTIEGTETIETGWAKRLPSFRQTAVPVENLFKYDQEKFGTQVVRFLYFKNDTAHRLGQTPLPGGTIKIFQTLDDDAHLAYLGQDRSRYIPVGQKVELNLGPCAGVSIVPRRMNLERRDFVFNQKGNVWGYTQVEKRTIEIDNFRNTRSKIEIREHLKHPYWKITVDDKDAGYRKIDVQTIAFTLQMAPNSSRKITYHLAYLEGKNRESR